MSGRCRTCMHPERDAIDRALVTGTPLRTLEERYGISRSSLARHKDNCLAQTVQRAAEEREAADLEHGGDLMRAWESYKSEVDRILTEHSDDPRIVLQAVSRGTRLFETRAKLEGRYTDGTTVNVSLGAVELERIRTTILIALENHPEARQQVARALMDLSDEPGTDT